MTSLRPVQWLKNPESTIEGDDWSSPSNNKLSSTFLDIENILPSKEESLEGKKLCDNIDKCSSVYDMKRASVGGSDHDTDRTSEKTSISCPPLIGLDDVKKMYPIIIANIPDTITLEDIYNLTLESEPLAFTPICSTPGRNIKFCKIYQKDSDKLRYLKQKLDGFHICGKKLIVVEPSELLAGVKWDI